MLVVCVLLLYAFIDSGNLPNVDNGIVIFLLPPWDVMQLTPVMLAMPSGEKAYEPVLAMGSGAFQYLPAVVCCY